MREIVLLEDVIKFLKENANATIRVVEIADVIKYAVFLDFALVCFISNEVFEKLDLILVGKGKNFLDKEVSIFELNNHV